MKLDALESEIAAVHTSLLSRLIGRKPAAAKPALSSKAQGKQREKAEVLALSITRPVVRHEGAAPSLSKLGTELIKTTITRVEADSPAALAGLSVFDRILSVDGESLVEGGASLASLVQFKRNPLVRVERPPRSAWPSVAAGLTSSGFDQEWLGAVEACIVGDEGLAATCISLLGEHGVAWGERRLTHSEAIAVALRQLATSDDSLHGGCGGTKHTSAREGELLVEVALEFERHGVVQLLLSGADSFWSSDPHELGAPHTTHARNPSGGKARCGGVTPRPHSMAPTLGMLDGGGGVFYAYDATRNSGSSSGGSRGGGSSAEGSSGHGGSFYSFVHSDQQTGTAPPSSSSSSGDYM